MSVLKFICNQIKKHLQGFAIGVGVLALCLYVRSCTKAQIENKTSPFPAGVKEIVSVEHGKVTVQTKDGGVRTVTGVRSGKLVIKDDNTTVLETKTYGFEHEIGLDGSLGTEDGAVGLDLRFWYWKQFDAMVGFNYSPKHNFGNAWLGAGYTLSTSWVSNTTLFVGYTIRQYPIIGISVKF